jgi:hypothetical protein
LSLPSVADGKLCSMFLKSFNASSEAGFVSAMGLRRHNGDSRALERPQSTIVLDRKAVIEIESS